MLPPDLRWACLDTAQLGRNLRFARLSKKPRPDFVKTVLFSRPLWRASSPRSRKNKTRSIRCGFLVRREDRIRTCDPLVPNQVRYRPALLPERVQRMNDLVPAPDRGPG